MATDILTKHCQRCHRDLALTDFYRCKSFDDGLDRVCKSCNSAKKVSYRQSAKGKAANAWHSITCRTNGNAADRHARIYAGIEVRMTRQEFLAWAIPIYSEWMKQHPDDTPSVDRKDPTGHYEIGNLQIISLSDNSQITRRNKTWSAPPGTAWCSGCKDYHPVANFGTRTPLAWCPDGLRTYCHQCESKRTTKLKSEKRRKKRASEGRSAWSKMTHEAANTIRERYSTGDVTLAALASEYDVCISTIHAIVKRLRWA